MFTNIDTLNLGKLLQTSYGKKKVPPKSKVSGGFALLLKKGPPGAKK